MPTTKEAQTFTVRFPSHLHQDVRTLASQRSMSVNHLLQQITEEYLRDEEFKQLFDSFTLLGQDSEECDVEYAWPAFVEAVEQVDG